MDGDRALRVLGTLLRGEGFEATDDELAALARAGLVAWLDAARLARIRRFDELGPARTLSTVEQVEAALAEVEALLRSDWHRMISFAATLRAEESRRAILRSLLAALRDETEWAAVQAARAALAQVPSEAEWLSAGPDRRVALTRRGWRAMLALETRRATYGSQPFEVFAARFGKVDDGMRALATDYSTVVRGLTDVPKNRSAAAVGLLKSGRPVDAALAGYRKARAEVGRGRLAVEVPHAAVAAVRVAGEADPKRGASALEAATKALVAAGFPATPVVRGAAKAIARAPSVAEAARRMRGLYDGLSGRGDDAVRHAARLFPAAGTVPEVLDRVRRALGHGWDLPAAVVLAANSDSPATLDAAAKRLDALCAELVARRAFPNPARVPPSAAELVSVRGTAAEVVEVVRQLVSHLPAHEDRERWGMSDDWEIAVSFARRFAW